MCSTARFSLPVESESYGLGDDQDSLVRDYCREALQETGDYGVDDPNAPVVSLAIELCQRDGIEVDRHNVYVTLLDVAEICDIEID